MKNLADLIVNVAWITIADLWITLGGGGGCPLTYCSRNTVKSKRNLNKSNGSSFMALVSSTASSGIQSALVVTHFFTAPVLKQNLLSWNGHKNSFSVVI